MQPTDANSPDLIAQAIASTDKLLESLRAAAAEGAQPSAGLSPEASQTGALAVHKALDAAARTLAELRGLQPVLPAAETKAPDPKRADSR
jgi:hypothetical protein